MDLKNAFTLIAIGLVSAGCLAGAQQTRETDTVTGIEKWEIREHGVTFSLTQILPDQARAFYVNRGITSAQIESYATSCVFMTVLRNDDAPGRVHFVRKDWSVVANGKSQPPLSTPDWIQRLKNNDVKPSALIAFRWAQFPPEQEHDPGGDWNQGMLTTGLPAGSKFDLIARWDINGEPYETALHDVRCAK